MVFRVPFPPNMTLSEFPALTFSFWFRCAQPLGIAIGIDRRETFKFEFVLLNGEFILHYVVRQPNGNWVGKAFSVGKQFQWNHWTHICFVISTSIPKVYINGVNMSLSVRTPLPKWVLSHLTSLLDLNLEHHWKGDVIYFGCSTDIFEYYPELMAMNRQFFDPQVTYATPTDNNILSKYCQGISLGFSFNVHALRLETLRILCETVFPNLTKQLGSSFHSFLPYLEVILFFFLFFLFTQHLFRRLSLHLFLFSLKLIPQFVWKHFSSSVQSFSIPWKKILYCLTPRLPVIL